MANKRRNLLCIDDHEASLAGWCLFLQNAGYSVQTARNPQEGLELFAVRGIDLVLLDYAMPGMTGNEVAATMKRIKPDVRIVMFSGLSLPESELGGADAFVQKGEDPAVVLHTIEALLGKQSS